MSGGRIRIGRVVTFDPASGLGIVRSGDGHDYPFHCVEIADGARTIAVDEAVAFVELLKLGRSEAGGLTSISGHRDG